MSSYRIIFLGIVALGLMCGACGPLPRAFKPEHKPLSNALYQVENIKGVVVGRIEGVPDNFAAALAEKLVENFHKVDIPASTSHAHRHGHLLTGTAKFETADGKRRYLIIDWKLNNKIGEKIWLKTIRQQLRPGHWEIDNEAALQRIALYSVTKIAKLFRSNAAHTVSVPLPKSVVVGAVVGAPGDGGRVLPLAIRSVLRQGGVAVIDTPSEADLSLSAKIKVDPDSAAHDRVTILWEFRDKVGSVVRRMRQSNGIPKGRMSQPWGRLAYDIAIAMRDSVHDTLASLPREDIAKPARTRMPDMDQVMDQKDSKPLAGESSDALLLRLENTQIFEPHRNFEKARGDRLLEGLEYTRIDAKP
ncbi:MAG: hypothetical protein CMM76_09160 [Rhodospirillaceae bacterium]|nr:hypothetical protein [Rhodospirillaceae bacterium]